jgi:hypothetical protein
MDFDHLGHRIIWIYYDSPYVLLKLLFYYYAIRMIWEWEGSLLTHDVRTLDSTHENKMD